MTLKVGADDVVAAYVGSTPVVAMYVGSEQIWPTGPTPGPLTAYSGTGGRPSSVFDLSGTNQITLVFSLTLGTAPGSAQLIMEHTANTTSTNGFFVGDGIAAGKLSLTTRRTDSGVYNVATITRPSVGTHKMVVSIDRTLGVGVACFAVWVDGAPVTVTVDPVHKYGMGSTAFENSSLYLASRANTSLWWTGSVSNMPAVLTRLCTGPEGIAWST